MKKEESATQIPEPISNSVPKKRHCIWDIRNGITITSRNCMTLVVINNWISTGVTSIAATTTENKLALSSSSASGSDAIRCPASMVLVLLEKLLPTGDNHYNG